MSDFAGAPTITTPEGGHQSKCCMRADLLPFKALRDISQVLGEGARKYGVGNWKLIPVVDHLNHAVAHIMASLDGNSEEPHLLHAGCRILFAIECNRDKAE
jgi:hypothetical protein